MISIIHMIHIAAQRYLNTTRVNVAAARLVVFHQDQEVS